MVNSVNPNNSGVLKTIAQKEIILRIETGFKSFCITNKVKYKSKTYYTYQQIYFLGAITAIDFDPPVKWSIMIECSREIIEPY